MIKVLEDFINIFQIIFAAVDLVLKYPSGRLVQTFETFRNSEHWTIGCYYEHWTHRDVDWSTMIVRDQIIAQYFVLGMLVYM